MRDRSGDINHNDNGGGTDGESIDNNSSNTDERLILSECLNDVDDDANNRTDERAIAAHHTKALGI